MSGHHEVVVHPRCQELHGEESMAMGTLLVRGAGIRRLPPIALQRAEVCGGCGAVILRVENRGLSDSIIASAWKAINTSPPSAWARSAADVEQLAELEALVASAERTLAARR